MLTSPIRSISDFSSTAGDVRLQIAQIRYTGKPARPVTEAELEEFRIISGLFDLGTRYGQPPEGNLDISGSSPEQIDLASALAELIPNEISVERERLTTEERFDVRKWAAEAKRVLGKLEGDSCWDQLDSWEQEFVILELEPFLQALIEEPAEEPEE